MSMQVQTAIIAPFTVLWSRALPNRCVKVFPLRRGDAGIGPLTKAVMGSVNEEAALSAVQWRIKVGDDDVNRVLTRFRGLADPLGHQKDVLLAGVGDPLRLGSPVLFVNRLATWSKRSEAREVTKSRVLTRFRGLDNAANASDGEGTKSQSEDHDGDDDDLPPLEWVPAIPGGIELHIDEKLKSGANRLMELWKGAVQTKDGEPGVTSLAVYDVWYDEIVILQAEDGMRILGDMHGFHDIPHFVPGGLVGAGGGIQGCNFSWTLFWRFELDPSLWEQYNASMMALLETVYLGDVACPGAASYKSWGGWGGVSRGRVRWGASRVGYGHACGQQQAAARGQDTGTALGCRVNNQTRRGAFATARSAGPTHWHEQLCQDVGPCRA
jgi:hypothetical protein